MLPFTLTHDKVSVPVSRNSAKAGLKRFDQIYIFPAQTTSRTDCSTASWRQVRPSRPGLKRLPRIGAVTGSVSLPHGQPKAHVSGRQGELEADDLPTEIFRRSMAEIPIR